MFGIVTRRTAIHAQQAAPAKDPVAEADEKILAEIHDHNEIMSNLEYLSDVIGARLTGTENLKKQTTGRAKDLPTMASRTRTWSPGPSRTPGRA